MLEFMFETASKLFILVLVTNAALPGVSEKEVNKGFSQPKYVLIYRTNMDHLESLHTTNKIVPIDKNHSQNQFCLNTNTSTRRQLLMYEASDFQVNVSKIEVNVLDSITLKVIMNVSGNISCHWTFKNITTPCNVNYCTLHSQIITLIVSRVTERHAGIYHLTTEGTNTINFPIFVRAKPRKPKIIMEKEGKILECTAESYPSSSLIWSSSSTSSSEIPYINHNKSIVSFGVTRIRKKISIRQCIHNHISCCASNIHGTECSSLYTQDLDRSNKESSVLNVFLKVGDPFLVRCIASYETYKFRIGWITNTNAGNTTEVLDVEESFVSSRHTRIRFLFITSVQLENSGLYTCASTKHSHKTVKLTVIEKGFINSSITNNVHTIGEAENFCFEVRLKAYPLVRCQWYFSHKGFPSLLKKISGNSYSASFCDHGHKPGIYEFFAENEEAEFRTFFTLYIKKKPSLELSSGKNNIFCNSTSYPLATVSWKKCNEKSCAGSENITEGIQTMELDGKIFGSKSILSVLDPTVMTGGFSIECCAENAVGSICKRSYLPEQDKMRFSKTIFYTTIGIFGLVTILFFAFIVPKYKKQPGYERQLLMIQVIGSSENDYVYVDFTNTDYDPKWEFPRENLELGNVLGSGAFGKVMEAMAYGINKADVPVQVAIKMLKEKYEPSEKDALMSELKMMIHMGRHENIVNLLGACTISGPVYLIFEYCCYGDLLNYLRNNRENFHKTWTDVFAHNNFSFYHNLYNDQQFSNKARNVVQNQSYEPMNRESNTGMLSQKSDCDLLFHEDELTCPLNTDVDYRNARRYEDEDLHVLTFEDLLSFSYQVAKGMEFLTSRSCIHRDLAARNVLVTHGKVAKICDFGLARDIMQDSNYVVRGNARLPVKWMAPESLFEGSYTTRSDVWSYGILLWEIFSLGVNPYPGIQVDSNFYKLIQSGFKMEQPFYATEEIYSVIQSCWALDPGKRLAFSDLVSIFEKQLADAEVALYHNVKVCKYNSHYKNLPVSSMECTSIHSATSSLKESTPMNEDVQM